MEKSIEKIWREGRLESNFTKAPRINNLDELKSIFFIDQFKNIYKKNILFLTITAVAVLMAFLLDGSPFIGLFIFSLFLITAALGQLELSKLNRINLGASNYQFLKAFEQWLDRLFKKFSLVYRFIVPLLFIGFALAILKTQLFIPFIGETLFERLWDSDFGLPMMIFISVGILILAVVLSFFSNYLFKREFNSIYGETVRSIKTLIKEVEDLGNTN